MKFQHTQIIINADFPVCPEGFIQQTSPISEIHDDLHARIFAFEDEKRRIYLISCDNLGLPISVQKKLQKALQADFSKEVIVTISSTHTHFAPSPHSERYLDDLLQKLVNACKDMQLMDGNYQISYQKEFFDGLGKSRISNHTTPHIYVQLLQLFRNQKRVATLITHNAHPTIHNGDTPYFSAEYPGYVVEQCHINHPDEAFTFMQGADGDISSRFTRKSQDWKGMKELADKLVAKIEEMLAKDVTAYPLDSLDYESITLSLKHTFDEIDMSELRGDLTERELETIQIGQKMRQRLSQNPETLQKEALLSTVQLGKFKLVFAPNELFSCYNDCVNLDHAILVCYSNGYAPYMAGLNDHFITYETFTDTLTKESKQQYMEGLKQLGK